MTTGTGRERRAELLGRHDLTGPAWCQAWCDVVDRWLRELFDDIPDLGRPGVALVAVGGYGRGELCPGSDVDVMLLHGRRSRVGEAASGLWYPLWDAGLHLGHSVRRLDEALELAGRDLETATSLLSARHIAGDDGLTAALAERAAGQWRRRSQAWLDQLDASVTARHAASGEVAYLLEPDLKNGRGGLRDVHALTWAEAATPVLLDVDRTRIADAHATLIEARVELHRRTGRAANVLVMEEQEAIATSLGLRGADDLLAKVSDAARTISWTSDDAWRRIRSDRRGPPRRSAPRHRSLGAGIVLCDGEVALEPGAPDDDPQLPLRVAALAARHGAAIERATLARLDAASPAMPDPWPAGAADALVELLAEGRAAIDVIEALDRGSVWCRILPEWLPLRSRPQHNPYHRFTVDRHLVETAANAAQLAGAVERPDLLLVGALLHDIGKGGGGDHTATGMQLMKRIATRMGFDPADVATLVALVQHHLLLPDVATRRDLDDPATIARVAAAVGDLGRLRLLGALTEADALATGASAWGPWRAELVATLVARTARALGGDDEVVVAEPFPTAAQLAALASGGRHVEAGGTRLTVMADDRPGMFSRVAGVLALHSMDVVEASAHSTETGRALAVFRVADHGRGELPWAQVTRDVERVLDGRLALSARISERARVYARTRPARRTRGTSVHFDNDASADATVIDVHSDDGIGVLYRLTRALAELDLDIRAARVQTLTPHVTDSFYVRDRGGGKVTDADDLSEIERAIRHSLDDPDAR